MVKLGVKGVQLRAVEQTFEKLPSSVWAVIEPATLAVTVTL